MSRRRQSMSPRLSCSIRNPWSILNRLRRLRRTCHPRPNRNPRFRHLRCCRQSSSRRIPCRFRPRRQLRSPQKIARFACRTSLPRSCALPALEQSSCQLARESPRAILREMWAYFLVRFLSCRVSSSFGGHGQNALTTGGSSFRAMVLRIFLRRTMRAAFTRRPPRRRTWKRAFHFVTGRCLFRLRAGSDDR